MTKQTKSLCLSCGKCSVNGGKCAFEDKDKMVACPTFIRQRRDYTKALTTSPFKCLSLYSVSKR
jgi:hypothetical protein